MSYSAFVLPLILMVVWGWGSPICSSFVISVIPWCSLNLMKIYVTRLACSAGSLARSVHAVGGGQVVSTVEEGTSRLGRGSEVWLSGWFTGFLVRCTLGVDGDSSGGAFLGLCFVFESVLVLFSFLRILLHSLIGLLFRLRFFRGCFRRCCSQKTS